MGTVGTVTCDPIIDPAAVIDSLIQLIDGVLHKEDQRYDRHRLIHLRPVKSILQDFRYLQKHFPEILENVKTWLQLLQSSLTKANGLLDGSGPKSCLACAVPNSRRLSKEIRVWKSFLDLLCQGFQTGFIQHVSWALPGNAINSRVVRPVMELLEDVIKEEDNRQILQTELRRMQGLLQDITTIFEGEHNITTLFQCQGKVAMEIMHTWFPSLQISLTEAKGLFDRDRDPSEEIGKWRESFDEIYHGLQCDLSILVTSVQFVSSKQFIDEAQRLSESDGSVGSGIIDEAQSPSESDGSVGSGIIDEGQRLSESEAWMLFRRVAFQGGRLSVHIDERAKKIADECRGLRRVAFQGGRLSVDIDERAKKIADECRGLPLAINVVAAAMIGKTSVREWDACLSSIRNVDPSFPATTHPPLDSQLYAQLRYSYDALPNSDVKRCLLYCAMYEEGEEIDTDTLLQMWIGKGLVKSKQRTYVMDMAIGRKYLKLLVDRCLFQSVRRRMNVFKRRTIRVHSCIRGMAAYIGQKEQNCIFMASRSRQIFLEVHDQNCCRISVANNSMEYLPTELRCPKLASHLHLKELPSELLVSLTSVRVLNLSGCIQIASIPTSIEQLRMLEFVSLSGLPIKDLPVEICHLSGLQFLDLSFCWSLESLPAQIGELKNLRHLNLNECDSLKTIPREIYELTSLGSLQLNWYPGLSVEMEAPASIWSLKGLKNLTELRVSIHRSRHGINDGIMGTWSEMRHLELNYGHGEDLLPQDMQNMEKLQSFMLYYYQGLSLWNCKFAHLEKVKLYGCEKITKLSPLEQLPNLKILTIEWCINLIELGIGSLNGSETLEKLVLKRLWKLKSVGGASTSGVWDERTLPQLRVLKIAHCESLKRFPKGMEKLPNLCALIYKPVYVGDKSAMEWWESIRWEDDWTKTQLQRIFRPRDRELKGTRDMNWMLLRVLVAKVLHGHQNLRISAQQMAEDVLVRQSASWASEPENISTANGRGCASEWTSESGHIAPDLYKVNIPDSPIVDYLDGRLTMHTYSDTEESSPAGSPVKSTQQRNKFTCFSPGSEFPKSVKTYGGESPTSSSSSSSLASTFFSKSRE